MTLIRRAPTDRGPILLVRWESRWRGFFSSLTLVLHRSRTPEFYAVPSGIPARSPLALILLHMALLFFVLNLDPWLPRWQDYDPVPIAPAPSVANATVLYLPAGLPELLDTSGAEAGQQGNSGGGEWYHPRQVIRISRAHDPVATMVDAPTLQLPRTQKLVANLVAIAPLAPVPPADSIERRLRTLDQQQLDVVPPAPDQRDHRLVRLALPETSVAPPPPEVEGTIHDSKLTLPTADVVPPLPISHAASNFRRAYAGAAAVVPPAPAIRVQSAARLYAPEPAVALPAPNVGHAIARTKSIDLPTSDVVPPPPAPVGGRARKIDVRAVSVVPPPPAITGSSLPGRKVASAIPNVRQPQPTSSQVAAGPGSPGSTRGMNAAARDVIVSAKAGDELGAPSGGPGTLALSPKGTSSGGIGGSGGGTGIARGTGSAVGKSGTGFGSAPAGEGRGTDSAARGGSTALPGPGGTNSLPAAPAPAGITVSGGTVHLPSFGSSSPQPPDRDANTPGEVPGIIIVASARAGGALEPKLAPQGGRVYTVYLPTRIGMAVLQYADPDAGSSFQAVLVPPQPLKTEIPSGLELSRAVVSGILDRLGAFRDLRIVQADNPDMAAQLLAALRNWRFRPVLRANNAVEVDTVLGFGVSTK